MVLHLLHMGPVARYICLLKFRSKEKGKKQDDDELEEKKIKVKSIHSSSVILTCSQKETTDYSPELSYKSTNGV